MSWQNDAIQRLSQSAHPGGGWAYQTHLGPSAEPTACACLALCAHGAEPKSVRPGLQWLARQQQENGGVAVMAGMTSPCWATGLAALSWTHCPDNAEFLVQRDKAVRWLIASEGKPFKSNPAIYGHDTRLMAWAWVEGTHTWLEPSAYAVLALRAVGKSEHSRVREAVAVFQDRALDDGGWNYGNSKMFGNQLRAFPAQSGMVLAAMAGMQQSPQVDKAIKFLQGELPPITAPVSLGWGLIGLTAWHSRPHDAESWLARCAQRLAGKPVQPLFDALLLLADAKECLLIRPGKEALRGA